MNFRSVVLIAALPVLWACSSAGRPGEAGPRHDPNVISREELGSVTAANLFEAIRVLRPEWLSRRNPTALLAQGEYPLVVYMDRMRFGDVTSLRQLPVTMALSVRYLSPSEAEGEFGVGNIAGAIQVRTREH